ncbi:MAG: KH domain-containing protein [Victivallales bacterium]|nr:KH domain-containing protein [Victivallales bacterium]
MFKGLLKLFGVGDEKSPVTSAGSPSSGDSGIKDLENFVDYIVRSLVNSPEDVRIVSEKEDGGNVIKIMCKKEDIGKIVGKKGKTIMAIRSLVSGAAGRIQKRVAVEVVD